MAELAVCATCGVQFGTADPDRCPVCEDVRQYVPQSCQEWTTVPDLCRDHRNVIRDDAGFLGVGTEPAFAIGQRALLVPWRDSNLLWDCITLLDDETATEIERRGGASPRLRSRIRITTPRWSSGPTASIAPSSCMKTTRSG